MTIVRKLQMHEYSIAAEILMECFKTDPILRYIGSSKKFEKDSEAQNAEIEKNLRYMFEASVKSHIVDGEVLVIGDNEGVACWVPPGHDPYLHWIPYLKSGTWMLPWRIGREANNKYVAFIKLLTETMEKELDDDKGDVETVWYLNYIGVLPSARGKGYARHLIEQKCAQAKDEGNKVYLESSNDVNPPLYRKFGFKDITRIFFDGFPLDIMIKYPE